MQWRNLYCIRLTTAATVCDSCNWTKSAAVCLWMTSLMRPDGVNRTRAPRTGVVALGGRADESNLVEHRNFTHYTLHHYALHARGAVLYTGAVHPKLRWPDGMSGAGRVPVCGYTAPDMSRSPHRLDGGGPLVRCVRAACADTSCASQSQLLLARQFWSERVCVRSVRARRWMRVYDVVENNKNVYPDIIVLTIENNICSKRDRAVDTKINGIETIL